MGDRSVKRLPHLIVILSLALIVGGISLLSVPVGMIAAGAAGLGVLTFDPAKARRVTWPR